MSTPAPTATPWIPRSLRLTVLATLLVVVTIYYFNSRPEPPVILAPGYTMAVLPIRALDPELDPIAGGLEAELRVQLGELASRRFRVLGGITTRAAVDSNWNLEEWKSRLGVDYVLDTTVRRAEDRLRFTMELVEVQTGAQAWAAGFNHTPDEILSVQRTVSDAIAMVVSRDAATTAQRATDLDRWASDESAELYLRALQFEQGGNRESLLAALDDFTALTHREPDELRAWAGMGRAAHLLSLYGGLSRTDAERLLGQAVKESNRLDSESAAALSIAGTHELWYAWRPASARRMLARAVVLRPNDSFLRHEFAWALLANGEVAEGTRQIELAAAIEPLSLQARMNVGWMMLRTGRLNEAVETAESTLRARPGDRGALTCIARSQWMRGDYESSAAASLALLRAESGTGPTLAREIADGPSRDACLRYLEWTRVRWEQESPTEQAYAIASIHALLGDRENALAWLDRSLDSRNRALVTLQLDPVFKPLHGDARFDAVVRAVVGS